MSRPGEGSNGHRHPTAHRSPMSLRLPLTGLALVATLAACRATAPTVASGTAATIIDGDVSDWADGLTRLADGRVTAGVRNDGERLVVAVVASDTDVLRHAVLTGLTVWVDPAGGTDRAYGVQFPVGLFSDGELDLATLQALRSGSERDPTAVLAPLLAEVAVTRGGQRETFAPERAPVDVGATVETGQLVVEVAVPLREIGVRPGQTVGVGIETPEVDRNALRRQVQAQMAARGGGGLDAGMRGGAGRPGLPRPVKVWVRTTLAGSPTALALGSASSSRSTQIVAPSSAVPTNTTAVGDERVGFELLQRMEDGTIHAWVSADPMTLEQFEGIELPPSWFKNQPRESSVNGGEFDASPGADEVVFEERFGFRWFHSATVVEVGVPVDDEGLLSGALVEKDHEIRYDPGSTVIALVSPDGETYVRIGRDAGRATDEATLPTGWEIVEIDVPDGYTTRLPVPTLVIRTDNQDSFQGPVSGL